MSGSLSDLAFYRPNAFALEVAEPFVPENIVIGEYTFLPWVRTGIIAAVTQGPGTPRADVTVSLEVQDDVGAAIQVSKTLTVRGPGDVLGFDVRQIVRRYPIPNTPNAEDTYFAHVEFDRPDFPWLFTPFGPSNNQLAPWLALVVLDSQHAAFQPGRDGLPPTVTTRTGELQSLGDSWAWAHAQVIGGPASGPTLETRLSDDFSSVNLSRLICPRKLSPNASYVACIVPAFDAGVKAARGQGGGTLAPAWVVDPARPDTECVLPVFDHWTFGTTADGDFWSLAKKIIGVPAPWNIGRRIIDTSRPGGDIPDLGPDDTGQVQVIRCALTAPSMAVKPAGAPNDTDAWGDSTTAQLQTQLNFAHALSADFTHAGEDDLPIVGPRIYARFQRAQDTVDRLLMNDDWFDELNLKPGNRVVAGLGTRVVLRDREQLMQAAWAQVGAIDAANQQIRRAQAARYVGDSLHARHLSALPLGQLAQVTRAAHGKLKIGGGPLTVLGMVAESSTAPAALTGAFRRATRTRGPLARYLDVAGRTALMQLAGTNTTFRDFRRAYVEPDGVVSLSAAARAGISANSAALVLNVPAAVSLAQLGTVADRFARIPSVMDQLMTPVSTWRPTHSTIDLGGIVASTMLASLHALMPSRITAHPARADALAQLFEGLAISGTHAAASANESVHNIATHIPSRTNVKAAAPVSATVAPGTRAIALPQFETKASLVLAKTIENSRALQSSVLISALSGFAQRIGFSDLASTPDRPALALARPALLNALHPRVTVTAHVKSRFITRPEWLPVDWFDDGMVRPIMAAPHFTVPMYERLDQYDRDWLVPGLGKIPQNDFVTLLETNPRFDEAFLAGASDEMGRELLWRGYPTDQRGTYFRRFWTADTDELTQDLHAFTHSPLGTHSGIAAGGAGHLVLVVRGELIKRYPDAMMLAMRAIEPVVGHPVFADPDDPRVKALATPLFHAFLPPDIMLVGYDLTEADLVPGRWWFVIAEHPTAPRFGLQDGVMPPSVGHAGLVAKSVFREPIRAAYEMAKLVAPAQGGG